MICMDLNAKCSKDDSAQQCPMQNLGVPTARIGNIWVSPLNVFKASLYVFYCFIGVILGFLIISMWQIWVPSSEDCQNLTDHLDEW